MNDEIWVKGPLELLKHGKSHSLQDSSFDLRIALISIDNAVEVMLKTFFDKNKRILGASNINTHRISFVKLVNLVDSHAPTKISSDKLSLIEKCHNIRNSIYHEGNGITVEKYLVETYVEIAEELLQNLFNLEKPEEKKPRPYQEIIQFTEEFLRSFGDFNYQFIQWTLEKGCAKYLIQEGNVDSNGEWDGNWEPDLAFKYMIKINLLDDGDFKKYLMIEETRRHFYKKSLPNAVKMQKALGYIHYFWKRIEGI